MIAELVSSALGLVLYLNTLGADFCYDDSRAIKTNQDLLPETPWTQIFYNDFWGTLLTHSGSHKSYRPLCTLSFRINHAIGGMDPWSYHLVNVLLHAAVTGLFTNFSRILFGDGYWTLLAGLLFASHPIHTEAVAGIVGRADIGACFFFLLSLVCYIKHCWTRSYSEGTWGWILGSGLCATCSMLWKEQGVTVLAVSAVYDVFVFHRLKMHQIIPAVYKRKNLPLLLSIGLLIFWGALLLGLRFYWMGNKPPSFSNSDNPAADSDSFLTRTLTFFYLPTKNLWLLLCPDTLSFDWSMDAVPLLKTVSDWRNLHTVAFYAGLLLLAYTSLKNPSKERECNGKNVTNGKLNTNGHNCLSEMEYKSMELKSYFVSKEENGIDKLLRQKLPLPSTEHIVVLSLSLLIVPFIPATNLFFYVGFVIAERVLYIPSMGFCLLITVGTRALYIKTQKRFLKNLIFFATAALIFFYGLKTFVRNRDWQDEEMLYKSGIKVNPAKAWGNLGNVLKSQNKISEAENAYRNALYYRSNMADMLYNLGLLLQENSRFSEALHYYKLAIGSRPTLASAYLNTGIILMNQGKAEEAKKTFLKCSEIPDENLKDPHAHKSSVTSCLYNLGKLYHEQGQYEDALTVYREAIQKMPRQFAPQSLYNMMGEAYMRLSRLPEAEHWYVESLRSKTDHIPAHLTYGKLLALTGRKNEAEKYFLKAIQLDPTKGNCYMHYGQFLLEESRLIEAAEMAEKAAELDNTEFDVVFNAAHMLRQASLNEAAEKYYKRAAELRPDYPAALMNLGAILHLNGKLLEAESNYLRALQFKPDDVITQSNLRKLWNIMEKQGLRTSKA
ncbi:protein O-mannosyl-transferase TMTC2 [Anolis carolinensis]|uniref:protein O-mannosyl-transferase TMTC2 n=1 Tax=Anolis carolinensis TaxID=28377 RepID=UPI00046289D4|nr:PREDICTED: transmembrane and TPR repeat-containing protein 2 [Anolis carolinensis]|eukprot:XP_008109114.1 PREDICTED: transmembrane and TPR repeat-containing protein 2 [Anolis carolinensis]